MQGQNDMKPTFWPFSFHIRHASGTKWPEFLDSLDILLQDRTRSFISTLCHGCNCCESIGNVHCYTGTILNIKT